MLKDITLGQYYPADSLVHRADPRTKILITAVFLIAVFLVKTWIGFLPIVLFTIFIVGISHVPFISVLKGLKAIAFLIAITGCFNIFLTDGTVWFKLGPLTATYEGLNLAGFMLVRICLLIVITSMLTLTTTPIMLTDGIETLLKPLKKVKVPVHEFAMMMTIALRFIPTLIEEADKIMKAQMARGADFESGNLIKRAKNMIPILVPLFVSAFRRADELAMAMESRCYHGGEGRTRMNVLKFGRGDGVAAAAFAVLTALIIAAQKLIP